MSKINPAIDQKDFDWDDFENEQSEQFVSIFRSDKKNFPDLDAFWYECTKFGFTAELVKAEPLDKATFFNEAEDFIRGLKVPFQLDSYHISESKFIRAFSLYNVGQDMILISEMHSYYFVLHWYTTV